MTAENFLTPEEEKRIIEAIRTAEKNTSGEIRVHLENKKKHPPTIDYVWKVFKKLGMTNTKNRNGVLFYVDVNHKVFTIIGDEGINKKVPDNFWEEIKTIVINAFKNKKYTEGLIVGILKTGEKLKKFFPYHKDDVNELSDEISKS